MKTDILIKLINEYRELEDKIRGIEITLKDSPLSTSIGEKTLLRAQVNYMKKYHDAILDRITYQLKKDMYDNVSEFH